MKVLLAGAFGNLGFEILKVLTEKGCEVVAADLKERPDNGLEGKYTFQAIDATNPETLKGLCDGAEVVITTMGLTGASTKFTAYDIDYKGNLNLYAACTTRPRPPASRSSTTSPSSPATSPAPRRCPCSTPSSCWKASSRRGTWTT